jgi:hypothetical protein
MKRGAHRGKQRVSTESWLVLAICAGALLLR